VLILEAQRCPRFSQRYAFKILENTKQQHMIEQNISQ